MGEWEELGGPPRAVKAASGRVSMAMVAGRAGVSGQTVSRVVNASPRVDPATRARVENAMAELGYRPHRAARALRTGRTQTIGLVVTTLSTVGNSRMLQATAEAAEERGYALLLVTAGDAVADAFERLRDQGVDGAIVLNEASALTGAEDLPVGLRVVAVDAPEDSDLRTVCSDHAGGAREATLRLVEAGHRRILHLAGPDGSFAAVERERGWREALVHSGVDVPEVIRGDWSAASGYRSVSELVDADAVFAANDQMALGVLRGLAEAGRRIPEDIAVIGFDDVPEAADYRPPLTTIHQDFTALAQSAVASLVADIEGEERAASVLVPVRFIERASTRDPRDASV